MFFSKFSLRGLQILFLILYIILCIRLFFLQIWYHDFFKNLAYKQSNVVILEHPEREIIFDRNRKPLIANRECISAFINPSRLSDHQIKELQMYKKDFVINKEKQFQYFMRDLSAHEYESLQKLPYVFFLHEKGRYYYHQSCASLIGITDIDNKGVTGLEYTLNSWLQGTPTEYLICKDARKRSLYVKKELHQQGSDALSQVLTIDTTLQFLVYESLKSALQEYNLAEISAVIINPTTGEILSIVSLPSYDPNDNTTFNSESSFLYPATKLYEFGSIHKVFVALAALEEGLIAIDSPIDCKNTKTGYINKRKINTWKPHSIIPFWQVIAESNNIGIAQVALLLEEKLYKHYQCLGFDTKLNLPIHGIAKGFIQSPANWSKQSLISLSYGYEIATTLLHLVQAFSLIALDGLYVPLKLLINKNDVAAPPMQLYTPLVAQDVKYILQKTTDTGTARRAQVKGYQIMSKTGSAHRLIDGVYSPDNNIYSCIGIVQKDDYQRVIGLYGIKEGSGQEKVFASNVAAPILQKIAEQMLLYDHILAQS